MGARTRPLPGTPNPTGIHRRAGAARRRPSSRLSAATSAVRSMGYGSTCPSTTALARGDGLRRADAARQAFSHVTAALLWGMPIPSALESDRRLHVAVPHGSTRSLAAGVIGHVIRPERLGTVMLAGLRVASPSDTWCQLGRSRRRRPGRRRRLPHHRRGASGRSPALCTMSQLESAIHGIADVAARRCCSRPSRSCDTALRPPRDAPATRPGRPTGATAELRGARFAGPIRGDGRHRYPEYRVGIEYQSDLHRDPRRYREDVRRLELLADAGWPSCRPPPTT